MNKDTIRNDGNSGIAVVPMISAFWVLWLYVKYMKEYSLCDTASKAKACGVLGVPHSGLYGVVSIFQSIRTYFL